MLTVEEYARIRRANRDGMSIREIARRFHHSRKKIREVLRSPEPQPYTRRKPAPAPKLGPFHRIIDEILKEDESAPPKQRHLASERPSAPFEGRAGRGGDGGRAGGLASGEEPERVAGALPSAAAGGAGALLAVGSVASLLDAVVADRFGMRLSPHVREERVVVGRAG